MTANPLDTPWKVRNELLRICEIPVARLRFWLSGVRWGTGWKLYGLPIVQRHRKSSITIGRRLQLRSSTRSNPLCPFHPVVLSTRRAGARIRIGDDFDMSGGTICADNCIEIGNHVSIGANSTIVDTDFHPLDAQMRALEPNVGENAPTIIEDGVFVGTNCLVLKGVRIGKGSVIGAGSVVANSIPPFSIAGGIPAKLLRTLQAGDVVDRR